MPEFLLALFEDEEASGVLEDISPTFYNKLKQYNDIAENLKNPYEKEQLKLYIENEFDKLRDSSKLQIRNRLSKLNIKRANENMEDGKEYTEVFINLWAKSSWIAGGLFVRKYNSSGSETYGELTIWVQKTGSKYTYPNVPYKKTWLQMVSDFNVPGNGAGTRFWETYLHSFYAGRTGRAKKVSRFNETRARRTNIRSAIRQGNKASKYKTYRRK